jgi:hypothetical protein
MAKKNDKPRDMASDMLSAIREGTKQWSKTRKSEERNPASRSYRAARLTRQRGVSIKEAAADIMEAAYLQASGNGTLPANARQIMYAARGHIQEITGRPLDDNYFTQTLLPDYMQETGVAWDVIYDARGHFTEPHRGKSFGVGTLEVRNYLDGLRAPAVVDATVSQAEIKTNGPDGNFSAVLFIEKEGFEPLFRAAQIKEKFDIAIMSTKGMSVVAARALVDQMCSAYDIPLLLLLLHDFDKAGFSIAGTLQRDTRRYEFRNAIEIVDLGLSLEDVEAMGLESEHQHHSKGRKSALIDNLRTNGASELEIAFMFRDFDSLRSTRRVELNAMTSPQFVEFVDRRLRENGIAKIVPGQDLLAEAYIGMERGRRLEVAVEALDVEFDTVNVEPPVDLEQRVRKMLEDTPSMRWDAAIEAVVDEDRRGEG